MSRPSLGTASRVILGPLATAGWVYGQVQALRRWAYRRGWLASERAAVPVISVGNLVVGGTGKTPCVERVCRLLQDMGARPAVLSRGYRGSSTAAAAVVGDGERVLLGWQEAGDEPVLLARSLPGVPVVIGRDRRAAARKAVEAFGVDVLVLDDGFQHLRLRRDLDLVTVDARNPFGNGACLPRGLLREWPRALADADMVLLTRTRGLPPERIASLRGTVARYCPGIRILSTEHAPTGWVDLRTGELLPLEAVHGHKVLAFAGIGTPAAFFHDLKALGVRVVEGVPFPDHHPFTPEDRGKLVEWARLVHATALVTTEKDAVRLGTGLPGDLRYLALRIELRVHGEEVLAEALRRAAGLAPQGPPGHHGGAEERDGVPGGGAAGVPAGSATRRSR